MPIQYPKKNSTTKKQTKVLAVAKLEELFLVILYHHTAYKQLLY